MRTNFSPATIFLYIHIGKHIHSGKRIHTQRKTPDVSQKVTPSNALNIHVPQENYNRAYHTSGRADSDLHADDDDELVNINLQVQ